MIIYKVNVQGISTLKTKDDSPIRLDSHRKIAFQVSLQPMQAKSREVHPFDARGRVQGGENEPDPVQHVCWQFPAIIILEQELQAFVPEISNHLLQCKL
jgi:hypothetical protein